MHSARKMLLLIMARESEEGRAGPLLLGVIMSGQGQEDCEQKAVQDIGSGEKLRLSSRQAKPHPWHAHLRGEGEMPPLLSLSLSLS